MKFILGTVLFVILSIWFFALPTTAEPLRELNYKGFTLWMDCALRGPVRAFYSIGPDTGDISNRMKFKIDENVKDCQQASIESYRVPRGTQNEYDRGHIVPANHLDYDYEAYASSYLMTNVVPQNRRLNRPGGAWRKTEDLIECWRENGLLKVWIGVLWGNNAENDHFVKSHNIATPDGFVKLVYQPGSTSTESKAIAWFLPNQFIAAGALNSRIIPPDVFEKKTGWELNLPGVDKTRKADIKDWPKPSPCDLS